MEVIKTIYFHRHVYKFEDVWTEIKFVKRNINDLNGFLCCLCCIIPFSALKACTMSLIHLIILTPIILLVSLILFPYQLITIYITTLSTVLLGPKIKCILFLTNWLLYTAFLVFYLIFAVLACIYFSFYAAFKVTLSGNYFIFGGYVDPIKVLFSNVWTYLLNNTREFKQNCQRIKDYIINEDTGEEVWDISVIQWLNSIVGILMTLISVVFIMSFVLVEIVLYFIPFSIHLMLDLYVFKFCTLYFGTMVRKQPCLALVLCPFILFPILFIPIFAALYLVCYVWLYSALFNKAMIIRAYINDSFDCLQQWSYIVNTIILYNNTLCKYSFQSCWKCHCLYTQQKIENDGFDLSTQKTSKKKEEFEEYNPYEMKFRHMSAIFWDTQNNKDLVTLGREKTEEEIAQKRKQKMEKMKKETNAKQMNIERWVSIKTGKELNEKRININKCKGNKKKTNTNAGHEIVYTDSELSFENNNKHKYESVPMDVRRVRRVSRVEEEECTDSEELNALIMDIDAYSIDTSQLTGFSYPRGI